MLSTETQWKDVYLYESKFLRIRARKLTSKKRKKKKNCPMRPLFSGKNVAPLPRSFSEKTEMCVREREFMLSSQKLPGETPVLWDSSHTSVLSFVCTPNYF